MKRQEILNLGILAHVDAGKTTLTEQLLLRTGMIRQAGRVDDGTTVTDSMEIEKQRGISVRSACVSFICGDRRVNLIDTPGHVDFAGEVEQALSVLDGAVLLISASDGITQHTRRLFEALQKLSLPVLIAVNKIDHPGCQLKKLLAELKREFKITAVPVCRMEQEGEPGCLVSAMDEECLEEMTAVTAELDEEIADLFLADEPIPEKLLKEHFAALTREGKAFPLCCLSAVKGEGVPELLQAISDYLPFHSLTEDSRPPAGVIYKVEHDPAMGKACHVRLYAGSLKNRDTVRLAGKEELYKVTQIRRVFSGKSTDIGELHCGDIGAVYGLSGAKTGDIIGELPEKRNCRLTVPLFSIRLIPEREEQMTELAAAVAELTDEDPLLKMVWLKEERELQVQITGMMQKEILATLLQQRYGLTPKISEASVIYKETPARAGIGFDAYTMPKPCWAVIRFEITPLPRGSGFVYESEASPRDCDYRYQEHIRACLPRYLKQGMHGWEVTDLKVTLTYAQSHHIHTHPLDFFLATPLAFMDGLRRTGTTLLEPMLKIRITGPDDILGRVIGDILEMRGSFDTPEMYEGGFRLTGRLPAATSMEYPITLGSISGGRALYEAEFDGYQECDLSLGREVPYRGCCPLNRDQWILYFRGAINPNEI